MKLLIRSTFRHLKGHLLQTALTMAVTILITGMISLLFHFASSFQSALRTYALEENGAYHYKYSTKAGTGVAELFVEMERRFRGDSWFSDVELVEDGSQVYLILTVAHPGLLTSKTMERKFDAVEESFYERAAGEVFYLGTDHNYELLASYGDLSKSNGIYSFLLVFLVLLATVSVAAVLTLGAMFRVSAMQREREITLLSCIGADRRQIVGMMFMESVMYCLVSVPPGFLLGIFSYRGIQGHVDNIIYSLFQFSPAELVVSVPDSVALTGCAVCVILLSGLQSAARALHTSPMEAIRRTKEIKVREEGMNRSSSLLGKGKDLYDKEAARVENWLAKKSHQRFRRRNRPIRVMMAVTFTLCFVLNGFEQYATEAVKMSFDTISYNFSADLYSDDKEELDRLVSALTDGDGCQECPNSRLTVVREAVFSLRSPYPFSEFGKSSLLTHGSMLPDVVLQCIEEESFWQICEKLGISGDAEGLWGIFLDTERSWWSNGVKVKGRPYAMTAGERLRFYSAPDFSEGETIFTLTIAGIHDTAPLYAEITESTRMQILVSQAVFSALEEERPHMESEPGRYHISLRGNPEDGKAYGEMVEEQVGSFPGVICRISDFEEQHRQEKAGIDGFEFLCGSLIGIFALICICGNFTVSWSASRAREREFATLLSVGMKPGALQRMRLLELLCQAKDALFSGVLAGVCAYQLIYLIYASEYQVSWRFPLKGSLLGTAVLLVSVGGTDLALRLGSGKKSLSESLRMEE